MKNSTAKFCKRYNHINNPDDKATILVERFSSKIFHIVKTRNVMKKTDLHLHNFSEKEAVHQNLHII